MDEESSAGVPEWVVTYGDMMSLLLTFFIMLVSLSEIVEDKKYRAILQAIQRYTGYRSVPLAPHGEHFPLNALRERLLTLGSFTEERKAYGGVRHESTPAKDVQVFHTAQGTAVLVGDHMLFPAGQATLSRKARRQLDEISESLVGKPNKIEVVGHVSPDPLPQNAAVTDKRLLSYLRAKAVVEYLGTRGVDLERVRIQAAGDTRPLPDNGDVRTNRHDRVAIFMVDKFADHFQGSRENSERLPSAELSQPLPKHAR